MERTWKKFDDPGAGKTTRNTPLSIDPGYTPTTQAAPEERNVTPELKQCWDQDSNRNAEYTEALPVANHSQPRHHRDRDSDTWHPSHLAPT